jgi:serine/threonine-protein kinase 24/25/MST4
VEERPHPFCFLTVLFFLFTNWRFAADRNTAVRQHVQTSRGLFPHRRVTRKSEMTNRGLVVTEVVEDIAGPSGAVAVHPTTTPGVGDGADASPVKRSPIAELLYMRWLEGLKIKWPNILS